MTDVSEPEWKKGFVPTPAKWVPGMKSPNPSGRPKGSLSKSDKIARALKDEGLDVVRVVLDAAKAGDMIACGHILSRIVPSLRSQSQTVQFDFDPELPIAQQVESVLAAIAAGAVPPDVGQTIISAIGTLSNVRATEELETRLTLLEAKAI